MKPFICSHCFLHAHAGLSGASVGARRNAVLGEDRFKLQQRGVGSNPRWIKVSPTHSEASFCQVLKELVQPVHRTKYLQRGTLKLILTSVWPVFVLWSLVFYLLQSHQNVKIPEFLREFGKGHSLGHIHATNAVAMDAVVEWWVIQSGIRLELFHKVPRFICNLPLSYGKIQNYTSTENWK